MGTSHNSAADRSSDYRQSVDRPLSEYDHHRIRDSVFCSSVAAAGAHLYHSKDKPSADYHLDAPSGYGTTPEQPSPSSSVSVPPSAAEVDTEEALTALSDSFAIIERLQWSSTIPSESPWVQCECLLGASSLFADDDKVDMYRFQECHTLDPSEYPAIPTATIEHSPATPPDLRPITSTASQTTAKSATKEAEIILAAPTTTIITVDDSFGLSAASVSTAVINGGSNNSDSSNKRHSNIDGGHCSTGSPPSWSAWYHVSYGACVNASYASSTTNSSASAAAFTAATILATASPVPVTTITTATAPSVTVSGTTSLYGSYWSREHPAHQSSGHERDRQADTGESANLEKDDCPLEFKKTRRSAGNASYGNISNSRRTHSPFSAASAAAAKVLLSTATPPPQSTLLLTVGVSDPRQT
ncbi:MAG: hypothetical protein JOS17DRAFT_796126 [Linnemannia elongata]|nr:MAG: hypothetical protein JOS17DRAFT_796126 [Linnemannia elongata]